MANDLLSCKKLGSYWVILTIILSNTFTSSAQTAEEWAKNVNWDGYTHWSYYIKSGAKMLGPNALSVPALGTGVADSVTRLTTSSQFNMAKGEFSNTLYLFGNLALLKDVLSIDASYIPIEYYQMTDELKQQRNVYYKDYHNSKARGDVVVNMNVQLFKRVRRNFDAAIRLGFRLPSSSGFSSARFTDGMGYNLDATFGKRFTDKRFGIAAMAGIYCWQVQVLDFRQDDALLFGFGGDFTGKNCQIRSGISGYVGYMKNSGDKPIIAQTTFQQNFKRTSLLLSFKQGIHDFIYSIAEVGISYRFGKPLFTINAN